MHRIRSCSCLAIVAAVVQAASPLHAAEKAIFQSELIFPLEHWHNHGSCIVHCPNNDLITCWFHGSGERKSDDVEILGARYSNQKKQWSRPFPMADTPGFPDTNCCMIIDQQQKLWLLWPTIQANLWESALMKFKTSSNYMTPDQPPKWEMLDIMHVKHSDDFAAKVETKVNTYLEKQQPALPNNNQPARRAAIESWKNDLKTQAEDKLTRRLGWFTRAHPIILDDGRMLVGLYSDGFSFSLVGITDDLGQHWKFSEPIVGGGNIQPTFAVKKDGTIVAFMRDNGPPPNKILVSESKDRGETWSTVYDHPTLHNPGSGLELMKMKCGDWVCIYNDLPTGRNSLAVSLSDDEGASWKWTRHLEQRNPKDGEFHYPSIIEGNDGELHVSYSYFIKQPHRGEVEGKSIRYAKINRAWIKGEQRP